MSATMVERLERHDQRRTELAPLLAEAGAKMTRTHEEVKAASRRRTQARREALELIRRGQEEAGLNISELARMLKVSRQTIYNWLRDDES